MKPRKPTLPRPGAMLLIIICFLGSGVIRLFEAGTAIAEEVDAGSFAEIGSADLSQAAASCPQPPEPSLLLEAIQKRELDLDEFENRLLDREQLLRVAQIKLEDQLAELEEAEARLEATLAIADTAAENDIQQLTTVYENMKPKDAATIFETMDVNFAAGFLSRMRPDAAAGILTNLESDTAYAVSVVMAGRNADAPTQ